MIIRKQGFLEFWLRHYHLHWSTNEHIYRFHQYDDPKVRVRVSAAKYPDQTVHFIAEGPLGRKFDYKFEMPPCDSRGLYVVITWNGNKVYWYLNSKLVETTTVD